MNKKNKLLDSLIRSKMSSFSKSEKVIAAFFLEKQNEIAFISIQEISEKLSVGRSSLVRFAQKLGYDGFLSLKQDIKDHLHSSIVPLRKFRLYEAVPNNNSMSQIAENEVNNINALLNNFDTIPFKKAISTISEGNIIYTTGFNLSSFLAGITNYLLQRIGLKSFPTNLGGRSLDEQLINIDHNDVLIAFSLPPYSPETLRAAEFAKKQKCRVIAFTNSFAAPIVPFTDIVLIVQTDSNIFTNSFSAALVLLYALVNEIAVHNKARFKKTVEKKFSQSTV